MPRPKQKRAPKETIPPVRAFDEPPERFKQARPIGKYFLALPLTHGKWEIYSHPRGLVFVTYAETWEELETEYTAQCKTWQRKEGPKAKKTGGGWREQNNTIINQHKAGKAA